MSLHIINMAQAIRDGLRDVALKDPSVLFFAEGASDPTSVFGTLKGLGNEIGHDRIIEMPISENALTGVAIGAALVGKRPVLSFHRVEFALLAMEQIVNNAAKISYISEGRDSVPIVIRLVVGRGWGQGPNHSQSLESMFAHIPGLKVVMPTYPADAKGLIIGAVEDNNPVIFIENRWCHYVEGAVSDEYDSLPLDGPKIVREGRDFTVVAASYMTLEAMMAADVLSSVGVELEVLDIRVARPFVYDKIKASVSKTGQLLTVDMGWRQYGLGAEIVSEITEHCFSSLKGPPQRLGVADHPTPSSRGLIVNYYPDALDIARSVCRSLEFSESKMQTVLALFEDARQKNPIDTPHPAFKGPF